MHSSEAVPQRRLTWLASKIIASCFSLVLRVGVVCSIKVYFTRRWPLQNLIEFRQCERRLVARKQNPHRHSLSLSISIKNNKNHCAHLLSAITSIFGADTFFVQRSVAISFELVFAVPTVTAFCKLLCLVCLAANWFLFSRLELFRYWLYNFFRVLFSGVISPASSDGENELEIEFDLQ